MKFLALLLSLTTGCFATASEPVALELVSDLPSVRAAADEWSEALLPERQVVVVSRCTGQAWHCFRVWEDAALSPPWAAMTSKEGLQVRPEWSHSAPVMLHEIGHFLAVSAAHLPQGNIMCASIDCMPEHLTPEDIRYVGGKVQ